MSGPFDPLFPAEPFDVRDLDGDPAHPGPLAVAAEASFWSGLFAEAAGRLRDADARQDGPERHALQGALASACGAVRRSGLGKWVEQHDADLHRTVRVEAFDERCRAAHRTLRLLKRAARLELGDDPAEADFDRAYAYLVEHGDSYDLPRRWTDLVSSPTHLVKLMRRRPSEEAERLAGRSGMGARTARHARRRARTVRGLLPLQVLRGRRTSAEGK